MYRCDRVVVKAPCKINLSLDITGRGRDGYHLLETVMHAADLSDLLVVGKAIGGEVRVTCSRRDLPEDDANIAHRAAQAFFAAAGLPVQGVSIHLDKAIPMEAGLAGGSTDAAGVLWALNHLFGTSLEPVRLREIGLAVGADVPFCVEGGCALARGVGELLTPLAPLQDCCFAIAKPRAGANTRRAFGLFDARAGELAGRVQTQSMLTAIAAGDLAAVGASMGNVFEEINSVDEVDLLKDSMLRAGALGAVMSGSGTAVVGLFARAEVAELALPRLRVWDSHACLARPLDHGALILHAG